MRTLIVLVSAAFLLTACASKTIEETPAPAELTEIPQESAALEAPPQETPPPAKKSQKKSKSKKPTKKSKRTT